MQTKAEGSKMRPTRRAHFPVQHMLLSALLEGPSTCVKKNPKVFLRSFNPCEEAMAGRPVSITVGTVWSFYVDPAPPRPLVLNVSTVVILTLFSLMRLIFAVSYFHDCPQHPNIPTYLLGLVIVPLLMIPFVIFPCESHTALEPPRGFKLCLLSLIGLFAVIWGLGGAAFIFSAYQPNYDPTTADGLYCNKNLYTFAFWNAVLEMFSFGMHLAKHCRSVMVGVSISPLPGHSNV